jgi:hypothetical protein
LRSGTALARALLLRAWPMAPRLALKLVLGVLNPLILQTEQLYVRVDNARKFFLK